MPIAGLVGAGLNGFLLGGSLIVAIGAQNAFVLRQGLQRRFVLAICLVCALSDALLIGLGVAGLGPLIAGSPRLIRAVSLAGALFLFAYGLLALLRSWRGGSELAGGNGDGGGLARTMGVCLAFTFLNPHVYLDTVLLLGGLSARYAGWARMGYAVGAMLASFSWFFGLGYGARLLTPILKRPGAWRVLDLGIAAVMWALAAGLLAQNWPQ